MIPGLENANIVRYGVMHRNTFINSSQILNPTLETIAREGLFFAGQITGTEGYTESIATGMLAGINMARKLLGESMLTLPRETMLGAITFYITDKAHLAHISSRDNSLRYLPPQPINSNWGILPAIDLPKNERKNKKLKNELMAKRSAEILKYFLNKM